MTAAVAIPSSMSFPQLDAAVQRVREAAGPFTKLTLDERIALLESMRAGYHDIAEQSARLACEAKGHPFDSEVAGEEWLSGPMTTLRVLRGMQEALEGIKKFGVPPIDKSRLRTLPDGRLAVRVYPTSTLDKLMLPGYEAEAHLQEGITAANLAEHQAAFYKKPHGGRVCLVLGAGNVNAIPPSDVVQKLVTEGTVCVLKMNPVNAYLGPLIEKAFKVLVDRGFLAVVYGGAEEGAYLVNHPGIDEVHITGSDKTFDAMVWGPAGADREARKKKNEPLLKKPVSSELGNITPIVVVPGVWDEKSLDAQARNVAGQVCNNASFNCTAGKLLVTSKAWPQREQFLDLVAKWMEAGQVRKAYYPGAEQRFRQFTDGRKHVRIIGAPQGDQLPYGFITDLDRADTKDIAWSVEPWCTVLCETAFETADPVTFCEEVTQFLNEKVWGTLTANVLVHSSTEEDSRYAAAVETMVRALRYGGVAINSFAGVIFGSGTMAWGGHPSSTPQDIQSGTGTVHDPLMIDGVEKVVLRSPLVNKPVPPWFPGHKNLSALGRVLTDFEYKPSYFKVPKLGLTAIKG